MPNERSDIETNKNYVFPVAPGHTVILKDKAVTWQLKGAQTIPCSQDTFKYGKDPDLGAGKVVYD